VFISLNEERILKTLILNFNILILDLTEVSNLLNLARFLNHDYKSNARLIIVLRSIKVHVIAKRDIFSREEIIINYGDNYFGFINE
jgi:hypothetical protein